MVSEWERYRLVSNRLLFPPASLSHNSWYRNKKPGGDVMLEMERLTVQSIKGDENKGAFS